MLRRSAALVLLTLLAPAAAQAAIDPDARVERAEETGLVRFVGLPPGEADGTAASSPQQAGRRYLTENARAFGLEHSSVRATRRDEGRGGGSVVRYQQSVDGVDVLGGQFAIRVTEGNRIKSVSGEALPDEDVDTTARITATQAETAAIASVARGSGVNASALRATAAELRIFDARLMGGPGPQEPRLVYETVVTSGDGTVAERVFVDAHKGHEVATISEIHEAKNRLVCDAANVAGSVPGKLPCTTPDRSEDGPAHAQADVNQAYDYAGATYDYFADRFGRDSLDGEGLPLRSTVRACPQTCPYENASWSSTLQQMAYGEGFAKADDVVGHELTHGVTDFTSGLYYYFQSGAINESLSDIFGELVDLQVGTDPPGDRWLLGEDIDGGPIRNMADPPSPFGDPDRVGGPGWYYEELDGGGVHTNSGVSNKAAFLMTDGQTFNGQTVTGIGAAKVEQIYYLVATGFLTSASDYQDLGNALIQACSDLTGQHGITAADCQEVEDAVAATQMLTNDGGAPEMPTCAPGVPSRYSFLDDMEDGDPRTRWVPGAAVPAASWPEGGDAVGWYPGSDTPYGDLTYATSGDTQLFGDDAGSRRDAHVALATPTRIRPGSRLVFNHAYGFEDGTTTKYDGGVVEYTTDGTTWTDVPGIVYPGTISAAQNPLNGRAAFVGESRGYIRTVVDLASLSGQNVRFRFRIGEDQSGFGEGWHIDDVGVLVCDGVPPATDIAAGPAEGSSSPSTSHGFMFASDDPEAEFECRVDGAAFAACPKAHTVGGLAPGAHTLEVRAKDFVGNVDPSPAARHFTVTAPPGGGGGGGGGAGPGGGGGPGVGPQDRPGPFAFIGRPTRRGTTLTFVVRTPGAGAVRITGKAKVRRGRKTRTMTVGTATATARAGGQLTIRLRLGRAAIERLRKSALRPTFTATFTPRGARKATTIKTSVRIPKTRRR